MERIRVVTETLLRAGEALRASKRRVFLRVGALAVGLAIISGVGNLESQTLSAEYVRANGKAVAIIRNPAHFFTDITGQPYEDEANYLYSTGISSGCGGTGYCPIDNLVRYQMAIFIVRAINVALLGPGQGNTFTWNPTPYFTDVPGTDLHFKWIQRLKELNVTAGCGTGTSFCPDDPITNAQLAIFTVRARQYILTGDAQSKFTCAGGTGPVDCGSLPSPYGDITNSAMDPYAVYYPFIRKIYELKVLEGLPVAGCPIGKYCPGNAVGRAISAAYIVRGALQETSF